MLFVVIGKKISPVLVEIETALLEFEAAVPMKPEFTQAGFRAAVKIFQSVLLDRIWELQQKENMPRRDRINMVEQAGKDIRKLIKTYADIETFDLYSEYRTT